MKTAFLLFFLFIFNIVSAQVKDSVQWLNANPVTLSEVVINNKLNVPVFINRVKNDTSFYKAFRNLRVLGFSAINDIRMNNSDGELKAYLHSKTKQVRTGNCRRMETLEETTSGDIYDEDHELNYYTAQLYASLFFTRDSVCGEDNIVLGREFSTSGKSGLEKNKEQLKMLFFNPGKRINGLPFMSNKTAIFEEGVVEHYDMSIDMELYNNTSCYVLKQMVKPADRGSVVIDEMTTWFDDKTFEVLGRNYSLSYDAGIYDFKVNMEVRMRRFQNYVVPELIRYVGNWKVISKKRERGVFTATLFDFN